MQQCIIIEKKLDIWDNSLYKYKMRWKTEQKRRKGRFLLEIQIFHPGGLQSSYTLGQKRREWGGGC